MILVEMRTVKGKKAVEILDVSTCRYVLNMQETI
jgi:hypothetical protein